MACTEVVASRFGGNCEGGVAVACVGRSLEILAIGEAILKVSVGRQHDCSRPDPTFQEAFTLHLLRRKSKMDFFASAERGR